MENCNENHRTVFLGCPLMDQIAAVDRRFLDKFGLKPNETCPITDQNRDVFREIAAVRKIGGSVTNTARILRKLTIFPIDFIGAIGDDGFGREIVEQLLHEHITCHFSIVAGENTGTVAVLLQGNTRTLITNLGASRSFDAAKLPSIVDRIVGCAKFFYVSALFLEVSFVAVDSMVDACSHKLICFIFNLGAPFVIEKYHREVVHLIQKANLIIGNEEEWASFGRINNINGDELLEFVRNLSLDKISIMTRGAKSILTFDHGDFAEFDVETVEIIASTNGAGDAFVAGFLAKFIAGKLLNNCIISGTGCAAKKIQNFLDI